MHSISETAPTLLLGVDGGNTKTVAVVAAQDGAILGTGRGGRSDMYNTPCEDDAVQEVRRAVLAATDAAGVTPADVVSSVFSMAGADWPEDVNFLTDKFRELALGRSVQVVNDAIGALWAGTPDGIGVSITVGTGIAIGARNSDGRTWYSGLWPIAYGGVELGKRALTAVYEAHIGLGPPTALSDNVLAFFDAVNVEEVLHRSTARGTDRHWMQQARMAPLLLDAAAHGDPVACSIVTEAGARNAEVALIAARAVGLDRAPVRCVLSGGVIRHSSGLFEQIIQRQIEAAIPGVDVVHDPPEPVVGAVLLAAEHAGMEAGEAMRQRLRETMPGASLFAT
jgi:N-acetylglucosamine kinase-like BadF-type ATPase